MTASETMKIVDAVVDQKMLKVKDVAIAVYNQRQIEFKSKLLKEINKLPPEETAKLAEPDTQLALLEAATISGRKKDQDLRSLLADLVIKRIKNDSHGKEDLKNVVYNEAISTVNKLTVDQLKIITLCYLLRYTSYSGFTDWKEFISYLNHDIKPFLNFKNTNTEFQHIEYAGCGSLGIGSWDVFQTFRKQYAFLFFAKIESTKIEELNLSTSILSKFFKKEGDKYYLPFRNASDLKDFLDKEKIDEKLINKIVGIYNGQVKNMADTKAQLKTEDVGKLLMKIWDESPLQHLNLTSVGIAIGASYFEQITKKKVDINIWIN
ncbi:hypothetical protein KKE34_00125 [Patescibacteria group bacterium]|nr:hypothetical protein [Patescibacteria group bacterium]MBU1885004.1 hypothetical protein [Patescibacteria group bacterium]